MTPPPPNPALRDVEKQCLYASAWGVMVVTPSPHATDEKSHRWLYSAEPPTLQPDQEVDSQFLSGDRPETFLCFMDTSVLKWEMNWKGETGKKMEKEKYEKEYIWEKEEKDKRKGKRRKGEVEKICKKDGERKEEGVRSRRGKHIPWGVCQLATTCSRIRIHYWFIQ